jgi:hypothetical protein
MITKEENQLREYPLPELSVRHVEYWAIVMTDQFDPEGREAFQLATEQAANDQLDRLVRKELGVKR